MLHHRRRVAGEKAIHHSGVRLRSFRLRVLRQSGHGGHPLLPRTLADSRGVDQIARRTEPQNTLIHPRPPRWRGERKKRSSAPAIAGEGDHWSSQSERTVVEGAPDSKLRCRRRRVFSQKEASEHVRTSRGLLRRVESCAPSTALRAVPLPRFRGGGKRHHILSKRLALPLKILALSSSESGTVCIQSSAGGFMTNGQSTANRI
jgi:hypothetical protein